MAWCDRYKQRNSFIKELSKAPMLITEHKHTQKKKQIEPFFIDKKKHKVSGIISANINTLVRCCGLTDKKSNLQHMELLKNGMKTSEKWI